MKKTLKIRLNKNLRYKDSTVSEAETQHQGGKSLENILDEMFNEGICDDRELLVKIMTAFNQKVADYTLNGYKVNTGLVKLTANTRGLIHNKTWNNTINRIEINTEIDCILNEAIKECDIEIDTNSPDKVHDSDFILSPYEGYKEDLFPDNETPACGIIFRQWLWKSI